MNKRPYKIHLEPEPDGGFTVTVPALPGCVTWGETYEHALEMAQQAIEGFVQSLAEVGEPVPEESQDAPLDAVILVKLPHGT